MECPACNCAVIVLLGDLGRLVYFRCRDCGQEFYRNRADVPDDLLESAAD